MKLKLTYLYPELMNMYADRGNVIALARRCQWHGIELAIENISPGAILDAAGTDFVFIGGGQDREQRLASDDLIGKREILRAMAEDGVVMLAVCGGYQLFGKFYRPADAPELPGVGILDAETVAGNKRLIGNVVVDVGPVPRTGRDANPVPRTGRQFLVGFENHSGKTFLGPGAKPLGKVAVGFGNNGEDGAEGAVYKNVFGTYLHGSLLPKNPWFTDHLIRLALDRRYGEALLRPLDDSLEERAHKAAIARARDARRRTRFMPGWLRS